MGDACSKQDNGDEQRPGRKRPGFERLNEEGQEMELPGDRPHSHDSNCHTDTSQTALNDDIAKLAKATARQSARDNHNRVVAIKKSRSAPAGMEHGNKIAVEPPQDSMTADERAIRQKEAAKLVAIRNEDYETAAVLRDQISLLRGEVQDAAAVKKAEAELDAADQALIQSFSTGAINNDLKEVARQAVASESRTLDKVWEEDRLKTQAGVNIRSTTDSLDELPRGQASKDPLRQTMEMEWDSPRMQVAVSDSAPDGKLLGSPGEHYPHTPTKLAAREGRHQTPLQKHAGNKPVVQLQKAVAQVQKPAPVAAPVGVPINQNNTPEANRLRKMCRETLQRAMDANVNSPGAGWEKGKPPKQLKQGSLEFQVKKEGGREMVLVRVKCVMDVPPSRLVQVTQAQPGSLSKPGLPKGAKQLRLTTLDPNLCLNWLVIKVPVVSNRDFVYASWTNEERSGAQLVQCSIDVEESKVYNEQIGDSKGESASKWKKGKSPNVRGRIVLQATLIEELPGGCSDVTWLSCVDPGGSLPTAKGTTAKKGAESVVALQEACYQG